VIVKVVKSLVAKSFPLILPFSCCLDFCFYHVLFFLYFRQFFHFPFCWKTRWVWPWKIVAQQMIYITCRKNHTNRALHMSDVRHVVPAFLSSIFRSVKSTAWLALAITVILFGRLPFPHNRCHYPGQPGWGTPLLVAGFSCNRSYTRGYTRLKFTLVLWCWYAVTRSAGHARPIRNVAGVLSNCSWCPPVHMDSATLPPSQVDQFNRILFFTIRQLTRPAHLSSSNVSYQLFTLVALVGLTDIICTLTLCK